jgi:DNA-binding HxlR family transcriptional regulator
MTIPARAATTPRPLAELFDLVGRRWTLRILWELRTRTLPFNDLRRAVGGMSQSVLVTRLTELFGAGLVADVPGGYRLTEDGVALVTQLGTLEGWAERWARSRAEATEPPTD